MDEEEGGEEIISEMEKIGEQDGGEKNVDEIHLTTPILDK